jgi:hypothetical protein
MKRQLLFLGTALLGALMVFPQAVRKSISRAGIAEVQMNRLGLSEAHEKASPLPAASNNNMQEQELSKPVSTATINWQLLCGSMNVNGMRIGHAHPLQYHPGLNAVSFIHRKSASYQTNPPMPSTAESGIIVAEVSGNWGTTWDSTAIYANVTQWGRYPQGAIYNPSGNNSVNNAYVVGSGAAVASSGFSGVWYASKPLANFNNVTSTVTGAQMFHSFTQTTYPPKFNPHSWSSYGFQVTDDGLVHSAALICDNNTASTTMRGIGVVTGTYVSGVFQWEMDSIIPAVATKPSDATRYLWQDPQMVWNPQGTIGYIVTPGVLANATQCNRGYQPMVYKMDKTLPGTPTWSLMNGIDFNSATYSHVINHLAAVNPNTTLTIPFVDDYNLIVDGDNNLHIGVTFMSTASDHPDSLNFISQFTTSINPTELYKWRHVNGERPYLYDFIGNGVGPWTMMIIDSISSEGPGVSTGRPGFAENPWDVGTETNSKVSMDSRIQMGRTPDGRFISISWTESDSAFTNNAFKWNNLPDLKVRLLDINFPQGKYQLDLGPELNLTDVSNFVRTRATLHFMSTTTGSALLVPGIGTDAVEINTPFTVTNSSPYSQATNNSTYYTTAGIKYLFPSHTGVAENAKKQIFVSLYPNPANSVAILKTKLNSPGAIDISIKNLVGQEIKHISTKAGAGENAFPLNLDGMSNGIYLVNITSTDGQATNKLVIE